MKHVCEHCGRLFKNIAGLKLHLSYYSVEKGCVKVYTPMSSFTESQIEALNLQSDKNLLHLANYDIKQISPRNIKKLIKRGVLEGGYTISSKLKFSSKGLAWCKEGLEAVE